LSIHPLTFVFAWQMYNKAGLKEEGVMFLLTDSQITNERFLIYINDLLASGNIPDLYANDEQDTIVNAVANKASASSGMLMCASANGGSTTRLLPSHAGEGAGACAGQEEWLGLLHQADPEEPARGPGLLACGR
jgi:hypothetical protein